MCGEESSSEPPGFPAAGQTLLRELHMCCIAQSTAHANDCTVAGARTAQTTGQALLNCRLDDQGIIARFVVGHSGDARAEAAMQQEVARHGDFLQLDVTVRPASCQQCLEDRLWVPTKLWAQVATYAVSWSLHDCTLV